MRGLHGLFFGRLSVSSDLHFYSQEGSHGIFYGNYVAMLYIERPSFLLTFWSKFPIVILPVAMLCIERPSFLRIRTKYPEMSIMAMWQCSVSSDLHFYSKKEMLIFIL